ncbi:hypothetical protein ABTM30_19740, partial [Acinetobacter baumannii]
QSLKSPILHYSQKIFNAPRYYPLYQEYLQILSYGEKTPLSNKQHLLLYKKFFENWLKKFPDTIFYIYGEAELIPSAYQALKLY